MNFFIVLMVLAIASIPWGIWPIKRVVPQEGVGYTLEVNVFGFFIPIRNLSDRYNRLERDQNKAAEKAKKLKKELEEEETRLKSEVKVIQDKYRSFLHDYNGKRIWRFLYRRVPIPSYSFVEPVEHERKQKNKYAGQRTTFTLEASNLPPEMKITGRYYWTWDPSKQGGQNQQGQSKNQRKKKGGGNNQNQGNDQSQNDQDDN